MNPAVTIKNKNDQHILRVNIICKDVKGIILDVEKAVIKSHLIDSKAYLFINNKKAEIDFICKRYTSHLEECSTEMISVDAEMVEKVKKQITEVKKSIIDFTRELPDTVKKNFPSYLLRMMAESKIKVPKN